jgi:hypothetical protein
MVMCDLCMYELEGNGIRIVEFHDDGFKESLYLCSYQCLKRRYE